MAVGKSSWLVLWNPDQRARVLSVEPEHRERPPVDGAGHDRRLEVECAAVWERDDVTRTRARRGRVGRRFWHVGRDPRPEIADARHHLDERVRRRGKGVRCQGASIAHDTGELKQVLRFHAHAGGDATEHEAPLIRVDIGRFFGGNEDEKFVKSPRGRGVCARC